MAEVQALLELSELLITLYMVEFGRFFRDGAGRADRDTRLFAEGPPLFTEVRSIRTKIALHRFICRNIEDRAMRYIRTFINTGSAAYAFFFVNHSYITVCRADMTGAGWTVLNAHGLGTLPADEYLDVLWIWIKNVSIYLDPGPGCARFSIMYQRAYKHTTHTSGAVMAVIDQVSL